MYAKTAAHLRHADQFFHKVRLFAFEFGELVNDNEQVRHRFCSIAVFIKRRIAVDTVHAVLGKNTLTAAVLRLDGYHSPLDLIAGQVGNRANHMRKVVEQIGHSAALIVNDEKAHVFGTVVDGKGKNVRLERFGLAGAGHTGHQSVGAVVLLVDVQITRRVATAEPDQRPHRFDHVRFLPAGSGFQFFRVAHAVHIEERQGIGDFALLVGVHDFNTAQALGELPKPFHGNSVEFDGRSVRPADTRIVNALKASVTFYHALTFIRQFLRLSGQQNGGQPQIFAPAENIVRNGFAV